MQLKMPSMPGKGEQVAQSERHQERVDLSDALDDLERRPWTPVANENEGGFVGLLFGSAAPGPKEQAKAYINDMKASAPRATATVREDVERTLAASWRVAHVGREASRSLQPNEGDLKMMETAIVEARQCRLVYAAALSMLSEEAGTVQRDEIRRVKERFNQVILELGRTADTLSGRLRTEPVPAYAGHQDQAAL